VDKTDEEWKKEDCPINEESGTIVHVRDNCRLGQAMWMDEEQQPRILQLQSNTVVVVRIYRFAGCGKRQVATKQ
jgi:hypothetical protein